jgi:hypothetical protein
LKFLIDLSDWIYVILNFRVFEGVEFIEFIYAFPNVNQIIENGDSQISV